MKNSSRLFAEIDEKAQPFEQRMALIVGLGENPLVEGEPGKLAIDEASRGMGGDGKAFRWLRADAHANLPAKLKQPIL